MSHGTIARRWARAIFDLGKETSSLAPLTRDLNDLAAMYESSEELAALVENPLVPEQTREAILRELSQRAGLSEMGRNTVLLLARKRRMSVLPEIARQLSRLADEDGGVMRAQVTSAGPLNETYLGKLRVELEKATGKKVVIDHKQDPTLIAGVVTRIGDQVIDGSVRARLTSFRDSLLRA